MPVLLSTASVRFPKGPRHPTLSELGILVPGISLSLVQLCCIHCTSAALRGYSFGPKKYNSNVVSKLQQFLYVNYFE